MLGSNIYKKKKKLPIQIYLNTFNHYWSFSRTGMNYIVVLKFKKIFKYFIFASWHLVLRDVINSDYVNEMSKINAIIKNLLPNS